MAPGETPHGCAPWKGLGVCALPGEASCLPWAPPPGSKVGRARWVPARALTATPVPVGLTLRRPHCPPPPPHPAVSAFPFCVPAPVWQESPMPDTPPPPATASPVRCTEQAPGYRCNLLPRNVPCSNHFFKLHKHNLCTVINYLAENDASC